MAYIKVDSTNRVTAASYTYHCGEGELQVNIPIDIDLEHINEYKYVGGHFVHDPVVVPADTTPSQLDRIEAQIAYTAMMTDTLLEV